jgi:hypothetical protein
MTADTFPVSCRSCMFWAPGYGSLATETEVPRANPDLGTCEFRPPTVHVLDGCALTLFPVVHADRRCWEWTPPASDPEGPDGGTRVDNVVPLRDVA